MSLDVSKLENVKELPGGIIQSACPVCRAAGSDKSGNHLRITSDGKFGCAANEGDAAHRKEIWKLAGNPERNGHTTNGWGSIIAEYPYVDEAGKLLFQVCRTDKKEFPQRKPDHSLSGWTWSTKGIRKVPFHLPQLIAADEARIRYIAEGEKDVLSLERAGCVATCNPGGAGKWLPEYSGFFKDVDVVVVADKDDPGRKHADEVALNLFPVAKSVRVIELPDLNGKKVKDASDFFAAGGDAAQLDEIAQYAPAFDPDAKGPWFELVQDGADMMRQELPAIVQIVEGILPEKCKLAIVSGAKAFKTWLTIYLALAISHGCPFLERTTERRRVLYVNLELRGQTFTRRLQWVAKALGITMQPQWFKHVALRGQLAGLTVHEIISRIIRLAKRFKAEVVIIDPQFKLNLEGDENSSKDQTLLCNEIDRVTTEADCTVILNDHAGKGNQSEKDPLDVIRGSSAKGGDLDAAMVLRRHTEDDCYCVDMVHRELPPVAPFVIGWKFPLMELRPDLDAANMKKANAGRTQEHEPLKLCAAIVGTGRENPVSISEWAHRANVKRQTLSGYLPAMRVKGWIATTGQGNTARQYLTEKGHKAVAEADI